MSEQLKFIVQELAKEPFNKPYNLISFDSLDPLQLLQVLSDVLAEVDPKHKIDVREEAADQTAIRIFGALRILKYKPQTEMGVFRQGLVQGEKHVVQPILEWLLQRIPELKKRAYLAKFLVKIEVPPEFLQHDDIVRLQEQYHQLIEDFKVVHKESETLKNSGFHTSDIKKDITSMEEEKEQLIKRIERLKRKVEGHPGSGPMLELASKLRQEKDKDEKLMQQKAEQKSLLVQLESRAGRLQQQLKEIRQASIGTSPEGLLQRLEEETKVNSYMVKEKLPKEISLRKKAVQNLQRVASEPAMGQADLEQIQTKIKSTNADVNQLVEKRMMSSDRVDDKISIFRQQAAIIARKKEAAAENLSSAREELAHFQAELEEKRNQLKETGGEEVLKGDDFKKYVAKLRTKSTTYKKKRQDIAELRAELGVLSRTEEILKQRDDTLNQKMNMVEAKKGVTGFRETQEALESVSAMKSDLDQMKGKTLEDMSHMVNKLNKKIMEKKARLAPIIKELRPLRQTAQELSARHEQQKSTYDSMAAGLESNRSKLEQEVRSLREDCSTEESRYQNLNAQIDHSTDQLQRVNQEMKYYMSADPAEKKKSLREQYQRRIQEQETLGKTLREKQKTVRDNSGNGLKQIKIWRDLERIMECKLRLAANARG